MMDEAHVHYLPLEVMESIFLLLNGSTLAKCRRVCKYWKELIDSSDYLWHEKCRMEFKNASKIAKRKAGHQCTWYHIYRNLSEWAYPFPREYDLEVKEFCYEENYLRCLEIDYGIMPLISNRLILYNTSVLGSYPITLPDKDCTKMVNNDNVTIIQIKSGIYIQRTVDSPIYATEGFFDADGFVLVKNHVYLHFQKEIFSLDLTCPEFKLNFIMKVQYKIRDMQYSRHVIHLFIDYAYIVSVDLDSEDRLCNTPNQYKTINFPTDWYKQMKYIEMVDSQNFVCYSRNLIKIDVEQESHLYLDFPPITALFFYVNIIIFTTIDGEILLYRLSSQTRGSDKTPVFENVARLPKDEIAIHLDVCERRAGPLIIATTISRVYIIEIPFFPHEERNPELIITPEMHNMFQRLQRLKERI